MPPSFAVSRTQIILGLCIPLAVLIGFLLAEPLQFGSITVMGLVLTALASPLLLRWHHPLLILSWNAAVTPAFLPGSAPLWLLLSFVSFLILLLDRSLREKSATRHVRLVSVPLIVLLGVVLVTAACTGGVGLRSLGGASYGGRGYMWILGSVIGYFAIAGQRLKVGQASLYCAMFFLPGITAVVPDLAYKAGQAFWWLFYLFPPLFARGQAMSDISITSQMVRVFGLGPAAIALLSWLLARYGMRGLFVWQRPWRLALLALALTAPLFSGFRSFFILAGLMCFFQFWLEGLHRTRFVWVIGAILLLAIPVLLLGSTRLPLVVQRTLSFLPIEVSPVAKASAQGSTEWRLEMWRALLPEVSSHFWVGKGYSIDPNELVMSIESTYRGYGAYKEAATAGSYHNGPLSVIIPFGIWGTLAFGWFLGASIFYLYGNYRNGELRLLRINTLLLASFLAKTVFFLLVFGMFYMDLPVFTGFVGFSMCLNGHTGVRAFRWRPAGARQPYSPKALQPAQQPSPPRTAPRADGLTPQA